jgi:hypothetical protein
MNEPRPRQRPGSFLQDSHLDLAVPEAPNFDLVPCGFATWPSLVIEILVAWSIGLLLRLNEVGLQPGRAFGQVHIELPRGGRRPVMNGCRERRCRDDAG